MTWLMNMLMLESTLAVEALRPAPPRSAWETGVIAAVLIAAVVYVSTLDSKRGRDDS